MATKGVINLEKILIFTLSTGGGHNEAAANLKGEFEQYGYKVIINDVFQDFNKIAESVMINSFNVVTGKLPKLYGMIYDFGNREKVNKLFSESTIKVFVEKMNEIIIKENPSLIISTHALLVNTLGRLKSDSDMGIPLLAIVTDYDAHLNYVNQNVDAYIAAGDYTRRTLIERGISANKIYTYGLPIKKEFIKGDQTDNNTEIFQILLMAGSLGLKGMYKVLNELVNLKGNYHIVAVCGHNKKLKKAIEKNFTDFIDSGLITLYGFTNETPKIMGESDLLITKPGGFTITEAISETLPIMIPYYIPGQEKENLDYLLSEEVAIYVEDIEDINQSVENLMENPSIISKMQDKMRVLYNKRALEEILGLSKKLMTDYKKRIEEGDSLAKNPDLLGEKEKLLTNND